MTSSRNTAGQILATSLIALVVMMFTGLALVQLADSANRTAEYLEKQTISAAHADAAYVYAQRKLDEAIDSGQLFADGDSDSGQVAGFAGPDAIWEWEVANTIEGAYQREVKYVRGHGSSREGAAIVVEGQLRSYSLLNYSWFSRTGTLSFGEAFRTDGDVYAGNDLAFNNARNQYFGGRAEAGDQILGRGNDQSQNREFRLEGYPLDNVGGVRLDTDTNWFPNTYSSAQAGGIVLPPGYDYDIDMTGVNFTQSGAMTVRRRTHRSDSYYSDSGTWSNQTIAIPADFNGIVFAGSVQANGNVGSSDLASVRLKGTLQGTSVSVVATDDAYIAGNTYGGTTAGDFVRDGRHPNNDRAGAGNPVNVALVARDEVRISSDAPRILEIEIATAAVNGQIGVESTTLNPAVAAAGTGWDLNMNGAIEANNADGWNEQTLQPRNGGQTVSEAIWHLMTQGPFISNTSPTTGRWATYPSLYSNQPHNRTYAYSRDVVTYPPPVFPAALSKYKAGAWVQRKHGYQSITGLEYLAPL